ncbi:MAG TPA: phosphate ABC transporter permease PstA [Gaiellaceae bacterium]|nr:phosphate ABC transporter permease PstA [Gaiellaceae bacterium]
MTDYTLSPSALTSEHRTRRRIVNWIVEAIAVIAALGAVALLVIVVGSVAKRGIGALNLNFFTKTPSLLGFDVASSGIANAIVGTFVIVGLAVLMALPLGILAAIYLNEYAPKRVQTAMTVAFDVLNGVPAIVIGIFVFVFIVSGHGQAAWKGAFALAILMLPLVTRSTQEVLALVPDAMREASLALGAPRWRTILGVVLPMAVGGIITGATLATARVAGETAPLLFTSALAGNAVSWDASQPLSSIPMFIFTSAEQADPALQEQAWGAALVLITFVLVASITARAFGLRSRRRLTGGR